MRLALLDFLLQAYTIHCCMESKCKSKSIGVLCKIRCFKNAIWSTNSSSWRKQPIFIIRHTSEALDQLDKSVPKLADPESLSIDEPYRGRFVTRSLNSEYSVLSGICTHLGCSPKYHPEVEPKPWDSSWNGGFFCPCHGSMFDLVGRGCIKVFLHHQI